jgi:hypothetical protein
MTTESPVAALLVADIHLSHRPPAIRSVEEDWYAAMKRPLLELKKLADKHHPAPVIYAGDIFHDGWRANNCPPELVNFALRYLPRGYGVPGQHDLQNHRLDNLERSAYWTLVEAGKIIHLAHEKPIEHASPVPLRLWGFPWGCPITPLESPNDMVLEIAVVHACVWIKKTGYPGAPVEGRLKNLKEKLRGYDVAVFGDNHKPLYADAGDCAVWNCGAFLRRTRPEMDHLPRAGILHADRTVIPHFLDTKKDKFLSEEDVKAMESLSGCEGFLEELKTLGDSMTDFEAAVRLRIGSRDVSDGVRDAVLRCLEGRK